MAWWIQSIQRSKAIAKKDAVARALDQGLENVTESQLFAVWRSLFYERQRPIALRPNLAAGVCP